MGQNTINIPEIFLIVSFWIWVLEETHYKKHTNTQHIVIIIFIYREPFLELFFLANVNEKFWNVRQKS